MRDSRVCPKCQHNRILLSSMVPETGEYPSQIRHLHVATIKTMDKEYRVEKDSRAGALSAAVCRKCGYTEFYTESPGDIPLDGPYLRELVGPKPEGPCR